MTRIIGGVAGGRRLRTPSGTGTRPTSDRVREALFSALEASVGGLDGLRVLDLYAGSGAVGLEALSRGAGVATLVEHDRRTATLIRRNVRELGLKGADVVDSSVFRAVSHAPRAPYDVVFLDPPYPMPAAEVGQVLLALVAHGWLAAEAVVVVERPTRDREFAWVEGILPLRSRAYGETVLWYGHAGS